MMNQDNLIRLQMADARIRGEAARKVSAWVDNLTGAIILGVILLISLAVGRGVGYWEILGPLSGLTVYVLVRVLMIRRRLILDLAEIQREVAPPAEPE